MDEKQNIALKGGINKMKTVQDYLRAADKEKLVALYLEKYPVDLRTISKKAEGKESITNVLEQKKTELRSYMESLCDMAAATGEHGKDYVLFAYKALDNGFENVEYSLVCVQELLNKEVEEVANYSYAFEPQKEIMRFKVSEAAYTQENIEGLLVSVLYEASFFGFRQERLADELQILEAGMKQTCDDDEPMAEPVHELTEFEDTEIDEQAQSLMEQVMDAVIRYEKYCRNKELNRLKALLQG